MEEIVQRVPIMTSVTVGKRGSVVIPIELRRSLDIRAGSRLLVFSDKDGQSLVLMTFDQMCRRLPDTPDTENGEV